MSDRPLTKCPTCGEFIEPDETDVIEAEEMRPTPGQADAFYDTASGMREVFHASCFDPGDPRYRRLSA